MALLIAECEQCAAPYAARRKAGTNCPHCTFQSRLTHATKLRLRECQSCAKKFKAMDSYDHTYCGACEILFRPSGVEVDCVLCHETRQAAAHPSVPVCVVCAKDKDQRKTLLEGLAKGLAARKRKYGDPEAQEHEIIELWRNRAALVEAFDKLRETDAKKRGRR